MNDEKNTPLESGQPAGQPEPNDEMPAVENLKAPSEAEQNGIKLAADFRMEGMKDPSLPGGLREEAADTTPAPTQAEIEAALKARKSGSRKRKKKKKSGCLVSAIWVGVIGIISIALAVCIIFTFSEILGISKDEEVMVTIDQGDSVDVIAQKLKDANAINYPIIFRLYSKLKGADDKFQYGTYLFNSNIGVDGIIEELQQPGENQENVVSLRIPEGATADEIMELLEEQGVTTKGKFRTAMKKKAFDSYAFSSSIPKGKVYYKFEGYLFPDTYQFIKDASDRSGERALEIILDNMDKKLPDSYYDRAEDLGYTMHEIMTLASIVEAEASGFEKEMPNVAAVFFNRLNWEDQPNLLGSTPTASYPYGNGKYDTNKNPGLPPGPICSPSLSAIRAVLYPTEEFQYDYFVTDKNMEFYYTKTLQEHNATIARLKKEGMWDG